MIFGSSSSPSSSSSSRIVSSPVHPFRNYNVPPMITHIPDKTHFGQAKGHLPAHSANKSVGRAPFDLPMSTVSQCLNHLDACR